MEEILDQLIAERLTEALGFALSPHEKKRLTDRVKVVLMEGLVNALPVEFFDKLAEDYEFHNEGEST